MCLQRKNEIMALKKKTDTTGNHQVNQNKPER